MRKMLVAAVMAAAAFTATAASAVQYVGTYTVTANTSDSAGLPISTAHDFTLDFSLTGNATLSPAVDLFDIWTDQTTLDGNDTNAKTISVLFTFTSPANQNGTITGQTFGVNGTINDGQVTWNALTNPISLNFGATTLSILLDPATFNAKADTTDTDHEHDVRACSNCLNGGQEYDADVVAHFTQTVTPGGVPEPASWALMIGGFGMTGAALRRRRTAVAATA